MPGYGLFIEEEEEKRRKEEKKSSRINGYTLGVVLMSRPITRR